VALTVHRLLEAQYPGQGVIDFAEGHLYGERLTPILQQIGKFRRGKLDAGIQGNRLNLLPFAGAINNPGNREFTEYRQIMLDPRLLKPLEHSAKSGHLNIILYGCVLEERCLFFLFYLLNVIHIS